MHHLSHPKPFLNPQRPKPKPHLVPVPKYLVARHDGLKDGIGIRALQLPGIKLAEIYQQVADLDVLVVDLRRVGEGLALAAAAVGGEGAGGLDGVVVGREGLELGGLGEGAAAEATDASDEALAGESAVAEQDEGGAVDLADALPLEGEPLAGQLEDLILLGEVPLPAWTRRRRRLGRGGSRRGGFRGSGRDGEEAAVMVEGYAAAEEGAGEGGEGAGRGHVGGGCGAVRIDGGRWRWRGREAEDGGNHSVTTGPLFS